MVTPRAARIDGRAAAIAFTAAAALGFLIIAPPVGDFWAARARASAAVHGVGLGYWFGWFGGTVPGSYSVLLPYLSRLVGPAELAAAGTVATVGLTRVLVRDSRHPALATWTAAVAASVNLWSGRVPFAVGTALMLVARVAVRAERRWAAVLAAGLTTLVSPVSGAFLALSLSGLVRHDRRRRVAALLAAVMVGGCLGVVALYYSSPGPQGFPARQAWGAAAAVAAMLLARPPAYLRTVLLVSLAACPVVALVPNGLGSNFDRFTWLCLPVAVVATGRARLRVTTVVAAFGLLLSLVGSAKDLWVASRPMSSYGYVSGLVAQVERTRALADYRVEVVPDGAHVAAYALLGHAQQAQGFETQAGNAYDSVLLSPTLDAASYRRWLDDNAVGYVAIDRHNSLHGPEDQLVRAGLGYLKLEWSDVHWQLFRVAHPTPVVASPARVVDADQSNLSIMTPRGGRFALRVRWSHLLSVSGGSGAHLRPDGSGWTVLTVATRGRYTVS